MFFVDKTPTQVVSCEICEIYRLPPVAAPVVFGNEEDNKLRKVLPDRVD